MIGALITSQTRIKLLKKFFLNSSTRSHLRGLEAEFGESSNSIRIELNRFEEAGLLHSLRDGNKKLYQANQDHPLYRDIHNIILKETGIDRVIEKVIHRLGNLLSVYLVGDFAHGRDSKVIELILVGADIDCEYLERKVKQAEDLAGRKVTYTILDPAEADKQLENLKPSDLLPLWSNGATAQRRKGATVGATGSRPLSPAP
jgi:DNA-binding transcriptional ArsR family regulator